MEKAEVSLGGSMFGSGTYKVYVVDVVNELVKSETAKYGRLPMWLRLHSSPNRLVAPLATTYITAMCGYGIANLRRLKSQKLWVQ